MSLRIKFILIIVSMALVIFAVLVLLISNDRSFQIELLLDERKAHLEALKAEVMQRYAFYRSDILVLADAPSIQGIVRSNQTSDENNREESVSLDEWYAHFTTTLFHFGKTRPYYTQLRFLNPNGMEVVRINNKDGNPEVVSPDELQNKSDRPYFLEAIQLEKGQVYITEVDFNVEKGSVVVPYEPIFRVMTALFADDNETVLGILVVNVDANHLLDIVKSKRLHTGEAILLYDQDGHYLVNTGNRGSEFSRFLGNQPDQFHNTHGSLGEHTDVVYHDEVFQNLQVENVVSIRSSIPFSGLTNGRHMILESRTRTADLFASVDTRYSVSLVLFASLVCLFGILLYKVLVRIIINKVAVNLNAIKQITKGDLDVVIDVKGRDEIADVAEGINEMVYVLRNHERNRLDQQKKLETANDEYRNVNTSLEETQKAVLNILEDLRVEKEAVEERVEERTRELEQERQKLSHVTQNMLAGAILLDLEKTVVFANSEARHILHLTDESDARALDALARLLEGQDLHAILDRKDKSGNTIYEVEFDHRIYEVLFKTLERERTEEAYHFGHLILIQDVTDERLLERSKSELVAVASHQLRTPLTAMRGNVEMLLDESYGEMNKEQSELLEDIEISTVRLITMVNDMLDITKLEAGNLEMTMEPFDPAEIIDSIVRDLEDYALRHDFTITHKKPRTAATLFADKVRTRQVFQNLIDNAVKYSKHPGTLLVSYKTSGDTVVFTFKDDGIGIPEAEKTKMFGRFYRASNTAKVASSGSGLGLYIVKSIVEQMGGTIAFDSEENVGTTFTVTLPAKKH